MPKLIAKGLSDAQVADILGCSVNNLEFAAEETGAAEQLQELGAADPTERSWLIRFPNTAFGIPLGLGGQAIMWKVMQQTPFTSWVRSAGNWVFWVAGCTTLVLISGVYFTKFVHYPSLAFFEWMHPVRAHFFNAPHLAVLMLSIGAPKSLSVAPALRAIWVVCGAMQLFLTQTIYARWLFDGSSNIGQVFTLGQTSSYCLESIHQLL